MAISDSYHIFYEKHRLWETTSWLGIPIYKLPNDMVIIQELICKVLPDFIIETGTAHGGSALFYSSILELLELDNSKIITIDINPRLNFAKMKNRKLSNRINQIFGSSINALVVEEVKAILSAKSMPKIMVFLDSWHLSDHVLKELEIYSKFVSVDSYIITEDTHINQPVRWKWDDLGPGEAVSKFLEKNSNFIADEDCEKLLMTSNPGGWIRRVR